MQRTVDSLEEACCIENIIGSSRIGVYVAIVFLLSSVSAQNIIVQSAIRISEADPGVEYSEVIIGADPSNPSHLIACGMAHSNASSSLGSVSEVHVFISFDRGMTWNRSLAMRGSGWVADPSCALGPNGAAYSAALIFDLDRRSFKGETVIYSSTDGGRTWPLRTVFPEEGDRDFLTVDEANGRLYLIEKVVGKLLNNQTSVPIALYDSVDQSRSFRTESIFVASDVHVMPGYPGGILPDGTYVSATAETPLRTGANTVTETTTNRGKIRALLYNRDRRPDTNTIEVADFQPCDPVLNSTPIPSIAVDRYSATFAGRVYVAWADASSGACRIRLSLSDDSGKSWSKPKDLTDGEVESRNPKADQFHPVLAVNRKGILGLFWAERLNLDARSWNPKFSFSFDGGQTFAESASLSGRTSSEASPEPLIKLQATVSGGGSVVWQAAINRSQGTAFNVLIERPPFAIAGGETDGLTADVNGDFHAVWVGSRGLDPQMWTATIHVDAEAQRNGSKELSPLEDVSANIAISLSDLTFDTTTSTLSAKLRLHNVSSVTINAPVVFRVVHIESRIGDVEFLNAEPQNIRTGARFDLTPFLPNGELLAGQTSEAKELLLHVSGPLPDLPLKTVPAHSGFIVIDGVVLGSRIPDR